MINIRKIWLLSAFFYCSFAFSIELNESDYQRIFQQLIPLTTSDVASIDSLLKRLENESKIARIIYISHSLSILSALPEVSEEQMQWTNSLVNSHDFLSVTSADHPRKKMRIVDISRQANSNLQLWEITQKAQQLEQKWLSAEWQWAYLIKPSTKSKKRALLKWLETINSAQALEIASYIEQRPADLSVLSNDLLVAIAQKSESTKLFAELWKRPADHIVYRALKSLAVSLNESDTISQIQLATDNPQLVSQALFLLSKDYGHQIEAQHFIELALDDPKLQLQMAMTVSVINDRKFKDRLSRKLANSNDKTADIALKQLSKESLQ
jgi:uncharacterized pyridoxal phosphate-containing UPF0001 family protein